ncbi:MAG: hypothetical protein MUE33_00670 [Cytophagaceae bacterium]|jgi:hypothetical protein|nr:hypothetical protein [Cytophagaceae bacterium]
MSQIVLDKQVIQSYSVALSEKLCNDYFADKNTIGGEGILRFTEIEQLNLFLLLHLYDRWKEEMQRIRSPYFDYEHPEVAQALKTFVNKLSKYISVKKEFFRPLVQKSVVDTLTYLLHPAEYIEQEFGKTNLVLTEDVKEKEKFYKLYKDDFAHWVDQLSIKTEWTGTEAIAAYKLFAPKAPVVQYSDPTVEKFNRLLKLNIPIPTPQQAKVERIVIPTDVPKEEKTKAENTPKTTLNAAFEKTQATVLDTLKEAKGSSGTLAEKFTKTKIEDLKTSIPLNMKFLFINTLFDGKAQEYNEALNQMEHYSTFDAAKQFLTEKYSVKYLWHMRSAEVEEFFEIVERKFY